MATSSPPWVTHAWWQTCHMNDSVRHSWQAVRLLPETASQVRIFCLHSSKIKRPFSSSFLGFGSIGMYRNEPHNLAISLVQCFSRKNRHLPIYRWPNFKDYPQNFLRWEAIWMWRHWKMCRWRSDISGTAHKLFVFWMEKNQFVIYWLWESILNIDCKSKDRILQWPWSSVFNL